MVNVTKQERLQASDNHCIAFVDDSHYSLEQTFIYAMQENNKSKRKLAGDERSRGNVFRFNHVDLGQSVDLTERLRALSL